jgi:hypothetical protein
MPQSTKAKPMLRGREDDGIDLKSLTGQERENGQAALRINCPEPRTRLFQRHAGGEQQEGPLQK